MPIIVNVDVMMAKRKMSSGELAEKVGITQANLSILKTGKAKAVRFSTLSALCKALNCQPGDLLEYQPGDEDDQDEQIPCIDVNLLQNSMADKQYYDSYIVY